MYGASDIGHRFAWPEPPAHLLRRRSSRPTQVYLICSARPRIGKTLLARLIIEYCRADGQPLTAYTIDPIDVALNDFLPGISTTISLTETRGQMTLFDRLVIDDATTKVVDIGHKSLDKFFTLAYDIEFAAEAHMRGIDVVVAFLADPSELSQRTYTALRARFPEFSFVPIFNDAVARGIDFRNMFPASSGGVHALTIPQLSPGALAITDRYPFSLSDFLRRPPSNLPNTLLDEIEAFVKRVHRQLRETELSLLLNKLRHSLAEAPTPSNYF
ncbi:MAG: hypothetical protein ACXU80_17830 [Xanthobacteraceae bacterium]